MTTTTQLSDQAYRRLAAELDHLTTTGRADAQQLIADSRSAGDIAENNDFHNALTHEAELEARIDYLQTTLARAVIVTEQDCSEVNVGLVVALAWEDGTLERFLIGSIEEQHSDAQVCSPQSPMGSAVMGARVGDHCSWESPGGTTSVVIRAIEPCP